ncbi:bifunctional diguanylate cyclase/phosphodiesterase [Frankia sp. QA3]|uniref:putative bifunctional diguanylate cyclase/phosphodiesterase n=1 Tax=Frankia sp. QA3 TaxID=710111 RepID=UPI000269C7DC|nr:EAL domain-containing protein [Frankia sp. QA3]EIV93645.1 PAS domain S-box/diguanylate cyclase (GGDEF) domain-containing protein [Frankia sp. QA3]
MERSLSPAARRRGVARFAQVWARAIVGASYPATGLVDVEERLLGLTERLVDALFGEPFAAEPAAAVGAVVAEHTFAAADALAATIRVCGARLLAELRLDADDELAGRVAALQGALAHGYTRALRERILAGQDSIHRAAHLATDARFRTIFNGAAIGIVLADAAGRIVDANDAFLRMLGVAPHRVHGRALHEFAHPEDAAGLRDAHAAQRLTGPAHLRTELRFAGPAGATVRAELTTSCLRRADGRGEVQLSMIVDVTERHRLQSELRRQARHDPLTGLPNRTVLAERVTELMSAEPDRRLGLCFIDLDGFKAVNDSLGHDVGDRLLVAVAGRLTGALAAGQLLVRMGGDEFVILLADTAGIDDVTATATAVLAALAEPVRVGDQALSIGASMGLVERPATDGDLADLLRAADITLYQAKDAGRGRWEVFDAERNARQVTRHTLSTMLPGAVEQDQFTVVYQPIVTLGEQSGVGGVGGVGGVMVGVEALVRWRHPRFGLLSPEAFIGLAEETGQIVLLGRRVLELACRQAARWRELCPDGVGAPYVSVNLTARQTREADLVDQVARILDETGLPARLLQLELTESALMSAAGEPMRALDDLAAMGVRIAIDDFGTGYSNLAYLRRLPVHTLKLAGPFVDGFGSAHQHDPDGEKIVRMLVELAHSLRLTVTAEGVETAAQAERLRQVDCDSAQGYLFAPPLPPGEITRRLRATPVGAPPAAPSTVSTLPAPRVKGAATSRFVS